MPYFYVFDPHSLCSSWNVPSSLPIELPTPSLRLASLFMPLLNLSSFVYLLILQDYRWMSSLSASTKARTMAGCAPWMGFHSFYPLLIYKWEFMGDIVFPPYPSAKEPVSLGSMVFWTRNHEMGVFIFAPTLTQTLHVTLQTWHIPSLKLLLLL